VPSLQERIEGGVIGLLVGDALGVPYEFHSPEALPAESALEFHPPPGFPRAHPSVPPGTWSDDGAQALCLLASLVHRGGLDVDDFGSRMLDWHERGYMAVDGYVYDVGIQTARALRAFAKTRAALDTAHHDERTNGNGALMRVLPLALFHRGPDEALVRDARLSSRVSHGHLRSQLCCALYCLWVRRELEAHADPYGAAVRALRIALENDAAALTELEHAIEPDRTPAGTGTGYVVDTLHSTRLVLQRGGFELVVKGAVALGHDTDTTAAVAGGLAGVRWGLWAIPQRWRDGLRGQELVRPLLQALCARWE
jgi:ADP-ribosyl-[dinitrogen reductase] hydrolase